MTTVLVILLCLLATVIAKPDNQELSRKEATSLGQLTPEPNHPKDNDIQQPLTPKFVAPSNAYNYTEESKTSMLKILNTLRSTVQPTASHMHYIKWNQSLAEEALVLASECSPNYRSKELLVDRHEDCSDFPGAVLGSWIDSGYDLATDYCRSRLSHCNYYRMMLRDDVNFVGCGTAQCTLDDQKTFVTVCKLDKGLYHGRPYHVSESPCQTCPAELPKCIKNLCRSENDTEPEETTTTTPIMTTPIPLTEDDGDKEAAGAKSVPSLWQVIQQGLPSAMTFGLVVGFVVLALAFSLLALYSVRRLRSEFSPADGRKF